MQPIHIFKAGTHTSAGGQTLDFDEALLSRAAEAYDPALHEAPIVCGHPKNNGPAFGWIRAVSFSDQGLHAEPHQINEDFAEAVEQGAYKKISASFYLPDSPANPKPGELYLRHVGFLGAQPPAIKGLEAIQFDEADDEQTVEFMAKWDERENAGLWRGLREWILGRFGKEDADQAVPSWAVSGLEEGARELAPQPEPANDPGFSEPQPDADADPEPTDTPTGGSPADDEPQEADMTLEELQAQNAELQQQLDEANARNAEFTEQQARAEIERQVDRLIADGKIAPGEKAQVIEFAASLDQTAEIDFGEGDKQPQRAAYFAQLDARQPAVDFGERSGEDDKSGIEDLSAEQLGQKAADYAEKNGVTIEIAMAAIEQGE